MQSEELYFSFSFYAYAAFSLNFLMNVSVDAVGKHASVPDVPTFSADLQMFYLFVVLS